MTVQPKTLVHATCVALGDYGALLRGPSGSGKSDLALRFMFLPQTHLVGLPALVADDEVHLTREQGSVIATCPPLILGKIEIRGLGIASAPVVIPQARLCLVVDLVPDENIPRFPEPGEEEDILGHFIPHMVLNSFTAAAPIKLALALEASISHLTR